MSFSSSGESSSSRPKRSIESVQQGNNKETPPLSTVPTSVGGRSSGEIPPTHVGLSSSGVAAYKSRPSSSRKIQKAAASRGLVICEVCGVGYPTIKGIFGHMRSHKNRGWKGAYPPPTFDLSEFSEYQHLLVKPLDQQEEEEFAAGGATEQTVAAPLAEERGQKSFTVPDLNTAEAAETQEYCLPDLNLPPPDYCNYVHA